MFKIMQTQQYDSYYNIIFTYNDECFLAAGDYKDDHPQLVILDAIDKKDIKENMPKTDYICYYSLLTDVDGHEVFKYIDEILSTGLHLDKELVS